MLTLVILTVAAFIIWHFLPRTKKVQEVAEPRYRRDNRIVASQEDWQTFVEEHTESPAERDFVRAMISAFDLKAQHGSLVGGGIRLDFQVEEKRYRFDFLVNAWLVVEIDGAAYHSSEAAVRRDAVRDSVVESLGYTVLRIPAKLVFTNSTLAVAHVREALRVGKREMTEPPAVEAGGVARLKQTMSNIADATERISRYASIKTALAPARSAVDSDKKLVESSLKTARLRVDHDDWLRANPQHHARLAEMEILQSVAPKLPEKIEFPMFQIPILTGDADVDSEIAATFAKLRAERFAALNSAKSEISQEPRIRQYVEEELDGMGRRDLWEHLR